MGVEYTGQTPSALDNRAYTESSCSVYKDKRYAEAAKPIWAP